MSGFIFYMHDGPKTFRFELSGNLAGGEVGKLDQAWRTASSTVDGKTVALDVTFLKSVDERGSALLRNWWQAGARFVANSEASRNLVKTITGREYSSPEEVGPTFEPRFTASALRGVMVTLVVAVSLMFPATAWASDLKPATLDAWDRYLHQADAEVAERVSKERFLWIDEAPDRARRVRAGEVVVMGRTPAAVPGGLVHHWLGAAFLPGASIGDVIAMVRDYDHYPEYYKPSVVDAKTLSRRGEGDRFSVLLVDKAMFMKRALDSDYRSQFVEVDGRRWYNVAQTTRVQEVEANDHRIPDGEGSGYIWRLCTISRFEERDGGVYIETEAMALSRPIPSAVHWIVNPIVRRVSRASLTMTLEQTRDAAASYAKTAAALTASGLPRAKHALSNE